MIESSSALQRLTTAWLIITLVAVMNGRADDTWIEINGEVYGAKPDDRGPIGGGDGYGALVTGGDFEVSTLDGLLDALSKATSGQTIFIPGEVEIDLTARIYIEQLVLEVPAGVTLAGDRGRNGSQGALLTSDALKTPCMIRAMGDHVRITGLRLRGPNTKRYLEHHARSYGKEGLGADYYYKLPTSNGLQCDANGLEVDNCEIQGFSHGGVWLPGGQGHHVHHSYIHHCQYQGLGYGVVLNTASVLVEMNLFDHNRHSIAGTGRPGGGYEAANNVELGVSLSHCFDMHGGRDRRDGTDIAGTSIAIHHNTFRAPQTPVVIRGVPEEQCRVHHNWFVRHEDKASAVRAQERTEVSGNAHGSDPPTVIP